MDMFLASPVAAVIFLFTVATSIYCFSHDDVQRKLMLNPYTISRGSRSYTVFTSGLIHSDWMHLIFNMMTFFFFAFRLEQHLGHWQFGFLYLAGLVLSDIPSILKHKDDIWYNSLGASGAISAVLFSYILFDPLTKLMIFPLPIPIPALLFAGLYLVYCAYASKRSRDNINHDAHFFGAIAGLAITLILVPGIVPHFIGVLSGNR